MEKDSKKIKEPFKPENTPNPPQIIDPEERNERQHPVKEKGKQTPKQPEHKAGSKSGSSQGLLGDNADIDD